MNTQQPNLESSEELDKLRLQNEQLKKELEKEQLLHKSLYWQWTELNNRMLVKEQEFERYKPRNVFYKYAFFVLLFLIAPAYYFLSKPKTDEKVPPVTHTTLPQASTSNDLAGPGEVALNKETPASNSVAAKDEAKRPNEVPPKSEPQITDRTSASDEAPLKNEVLPKTEAITNSSETAHAEIKKKILKHEEKKIRRDSVPSKVVIATKPVTEKSLADSDKESVYWKGWNAYYSKSHNPFPKSDKKYKLWLEGWKDGESDAKKQSTKNSP